MGSRDSRPHAVSASTRFGTALALLALAFLLTAGAVQAQDGTWIARGVDCPKFFQGIEGQSIRLDASGLAHIAYGGDHVYYARRGPTGWNLETVDSSPDVGADLSLDLDRDGYPHLAYASFWNNTLRYAYQDAWGWHRESVGVQVGWDISLALDEAGYAHVSYYDAGGDEMKYAYQDSAGWHFETIASGGSSGSSLALDPLGRPHLAYAFDSYYLGYAYRDLTGWYVETVPGTAPYESVLRPSLDIDGEGYPHVSYVGGNRLGYAYQDETGWHMEEVPTVYSVGTVVALSVSANGQPHISFYDDSWLKYATKDAALWHIEAVDSDTGEGVSSSITTDVEGRPHLAYLIETGMELRFARRDSGRTWQIEPVDNAAGAGGGTSLVLDAAGYAHISHVDILNGAVRYAYQDGAGWHVEVADEMGSQPTSLALDGNGYPHIAHATFYPDYAVRYAYRDSSGWHTEVVAHALQEAAVALALDPAGNAHLAYTANSGIYYAYRDSSGWQSELLDSGTMIPSGSRHRITLILDSIGQAHVAYSDSDHYLRHATKDGASWQIEVVDLGQRIESRSSIAIDEQGYLHVIFRALGQQSFTYAYQDASGLHFEPLAEGGSDIMLVLGPDGHPSASYAVSMDPYEHKFALQYAYRDVSGWHYQSADAGEAEGTVGLSSSLVLDSEGIPHISYWDGGHKDLKYAFYENLHHALYLPLVVRHTSAMH